MALSYAELDVAHRAALKKIVQLTGQRDALAKRLVEEAGKHHGSAQAITEDLARMQREWSRQETGHQLDRIAREALPAIAL